MSLKESLKAGPSLTWKDIAVEELGLTVRVRELTVAERDALEQALAVEEEGDPVVNCRGEVLCRALVDPETGARLFTDDEAEWLGQQPARIYGPLADEAMRLSGLTKEAKEQAQKNSTAPGEDSSSGSLSPSAAVLASCQNGSAPPS